MQPIDIKGRDLYKKYRSGLTEMARPDLMFLFRWLTRITLRGGRRGVVMSEEKETLKDLRRRLNL